MSLCLLGPRVISPGRCGTYDTEVYSGLSRTEATNKDTPSSRANLSLCTHLGRGDVQPYYRRFCTAKDRRASIEFLRHQRANGLISGNLFIAFVVSSRLGCARTEKRV